MREREREAETQAEGAPDAGLDPGTPGSCPGLKAGTKLLSHPGISPLQKQNLFNGTRYLVPYSLSLLFFVQIIFSTWNPFLQLADSCMYSRKPNLKALALLRGLPHPLTDPVLQK